MNDDNNNQGQAQATQPVQTGPNPEYDNVFAVDQLPTVVDEAPAEPVDSAAGGADDVADDWAKNYSEDEMLEALVVQMIKEKGVEDKYGTIVAEVKNKLVTAINNAIIDALPADFDMSDAKTQEELAEKIAATGVDTGKITKDTMAAFREDYLNGKEL